MNIALPPVLKLLRPHHWLKSGFVAAPLFFTPHLLSFHNITFVILGMIAWSLLASAIYIFNDWRDIAADKNHPIKKNRPLAAGTVTLATARLIMLGLVLVSLILAFYLGSGFLFLLLLYGALNLAYSLKLKQIAIVDVMCIALGFVLRVEAGAALIQIEPTPWLIILTGALALFLGFAKRRDDIVKQLGADHRRALHGYNRQLIDTILAITAGAAMVSYLLYTTDTNVMQRLGTPHLYATAPFVIFALLRYLQITMVEERSGSPTLIFLTDRPILLAGLGWLGTFAWLIYV
jgi:4-hydroxybenzoate polyprenyltransferase